MTSPGPEAFLRKSERRRVDRSRRSDDTPGRGRTGTSGGRNIRWPSTQRGAEVMCPDGELSASSRGTGRAPRGAAKSGDQSRG